MTLVVVILIVTAYTLVIKHTSLLNAYNFLSACSLPGINLLVTSTCTEKAWQYIEP